MKISKILLVTSIALVSALPAFAQNRDSDGDVISSIYLKPRPIPSGVIYSVNVGTNTDNLINLEMAGAPAVLPRQFSVQGVASPTGDFDLPEQVSIRGTTYQVEKSGNDIYLRPEGSNNRVLASVVQETTGKRVNPRSFALD